MSAVPYARWMFFHSSWMIGSTALALWMEVPEIITFSAFPSIGILLFAESRGRNSWDFVLQGANVLTIFRLLAVLCLFVVFDWWGSWGVAVGAMMVFITDGMDGWWARRSGTVSAFGAWLDKETDALYVLVLAMLLVNLGYMASWFLGIGLLRYFYFVAIWPWRLRRPQEPRFRWGKVVAGILMGTMPIALISSAQVYRPVLVGASLLVVLSFIHSGWRVFKASR